MADFSINGDRITSSQIADIAVSPFYNSAFLRNMELDPDLQETTNLNDSIIWNGTKWVSGSASGPAACIGNENLVVGSSGTFSASANNNIIVGCGITGNFTNDSNVIIGHGAGGGDDLDSDRIAVGRNCGRTGQQYGSVAIGAIAGSLNQGNESLAIGPYSGVFNQGNKSIALGHNSGNTNQGNESIAVGDLSGNTNQGDYSIAIGVECGTMEQGNEAIAIGRDAGAFTQGNRGIAIGTTCGNENQGENSIAMGVNAGQQSQGLRCIAIGNFAGYNNQQNESVAVGRRAGQQSQGLHGISIGWSAGQDNQSSDGIAIGRSAGFTNQGVASIAIGALAGETNQHDRTIILNAQGVDLPSLGINKFYVSPVDETDIPVSDTRVGRMMMYDNISKEITHGSSIQTVILPVTTNVNTVWVNLPGFGVVLTYGDYVITTQSRWVIGNLGTGTAFGDDLLIASSRYYNSTAGSPFPNTEKMMVTYQREIPGAVFSDTIIGQGTSTMISYITIPVGLPQTVTAQFQSLATGGGIADYNVLSNTEGRTTIVAQRL
jgi:hypothetical protein